MKCLKFEGQKQELFRRKVQAQSALETGRVRLMEEIQKVEKLKRDLALELETRVLDPNMMEKIERLKSMHFGLRQEEEELHIWQQWQANDKDLKKQLTACVEEDDHRFCL